jgi:hypothetical protein
MSSANYPQGMKTNNNHLLTGGYKTWKGSGLYSNPTAIAAGNIRPQTNKDYLNVDVYKHGSPRPMKWNYRKGISRNIPIIILNPDNNNEFLEIPSNRECKSSKSSSLIGQTIDRPGQYTVTENTVYEIGEREKMNKDCYNCQGIGLVTNYYPQNFLTDNPLPCVENATLCCNAQKKALKMVKPASTNLSKNYYTTNKEYLYNRCQTYEQKVFNFYSGSAVGFEEGALAKPGSPLSLTNTYVAQCYPNTDLEPGLKKCKLVVYKPSNPQFAVEGGVSSSTRTLKLTLNTIESAMAINKRLIRNSSGRPNDPFIYKSKVEKCNGNTCNRGNRFNR